MMIELAIFIILISLGYFIGQRVEKKHYRSITEREKQWVNLVTTSSRRPVGQLDTIKEVKMVTGNVVISIDYFKRIAAALRNLFGGNVRAYETLVDRARREAILRMKESCPDAQQIINLRIETSSISQGQKNQVGSVEVVAYGTAII